jgi:hypothetical protein
MKRSLLTLGILLLFATEILRVYFIMPFPGSQRSDTIGLAYFIDQNRLWLRIIGLLLVGLPLYAYQRGSANRQKRSRQARAGRPDGFLSAHPGFLLTRKHSPWPAIGLSALALVYLVIFYFFNFRFEADKMFYQPGTKRFAGAAANKVPLDRLVIGIVINNEAKAFPIQIIGYHHQVRDTIGQTAVMITYCTVCRTGRVYSPLVQGKAEDFRLVGMDHFNAMFEDATTKSWWQQATGISIAGPLKNQQLAEIPSAQSTLAAWLRVHPNTEILQPDPAYTSEYDNLADYDNGAIKGGLEHRDSAAWKPKSWVVGVRSGKMERAYDWNDLVSHPLIQDSLGAVPILVLLGADSTDFHAWSRNVRGQSLQFERIPGQSMMKDNNTGSLWNLDGLCESGPLKDQQLQPIPCYQEFWHSWSHFHPATSQYKL